MQDAGKKHVPTLYDVAALAKVSVATVSHVLNSESNKYVSEELSRRVRDAALALDYRPNYLARGMRGKKRRTIAILVPQFENILFTRIVMAAEQVAFDAGYVLLICSTYDNFEREKVYIESLISQQVDGFLIVPTMHGTAITKPLRQRRIPYVAVDRLLPGIQFGTYDYVGFDNRLGAEMATQYLIERGHCRIGFIGWRSEIPMINERYAGFLAVLGRNGLDINSCPVLLGNYSRKEGEKLALQLLQNQSVSAIFAAHQFMAEGIILALQQLNKWFPRDLSLIVYGRPTWTELTNPLLVSVGMPEIEIGESSARLLIERIEGKHNEPQQFMLAPHITAGGSISDYLAK